MDNYAQDVQRRKDLKAAYPGEKWCKRVDKMASGQVLAIWFKLKKEGKVA